MKRLTLYLGLAFAVCMLLSSSSGAQTGDLFGRMEGADTPGSTGLAVLGYSMNRMRVISIPSGEEHVFFAEAEAETFGPPAFDPSSSTLYYIDRKRAIKAWRLGNARSEVVCPFPRDTLPMLSFWLLLSPNKNSLLFAPYSRGGGYPRLHLYDLATKEERIVFEDKRFLGSQRPAWLSPTRLLIETAVQKGDGYEYRIEELDLTTRETKVLVRDIGLGFSLSPDRDRLCTGTLRGDFVIRKFPSLEVVKTIRTSDLPGSGGRGEFCLVSQRYLVLFREQSVWAPLGTYAIDLDDPGTKALKLSPQLLDSMHYLPSLPTGKEAR